MMTKFLVSIVLALSVASVVGIYATHVFSDVSAALDASAR